MIDVNISLSRWPSRRLPLDETPLLVEKLRSLGVVEAWASTFDGLLHKDVADVNARLANECRQHGAGMLRPFGVVNILLPDWPEDLRRCREQFAMPGLRLFPNYHGYSLTEPDLGNLFALASESGLIVQLVARLEDPRIQHRLLAVADVDLTPLPALVKEHPGLRLVVLNGLNVRPDLVDSLAAAGHVYFDIGALEGVGGLERLIAHLPLERVLLGTHAPYFTPESAILKLQESYLGRSATQAVCHDNARMLLRSRDH